MSKVDEIRINAYVILVSANRMDLKEVPEKYRTEVEIQVAKRTLEILGNE